MKFSSAHTQWLRFRSVWLTSEKAGALLDTFFASLLLLILIPILAMRAIFALCLVGKVFEKRRVVGKYGRSLHLLEFAGNMPARRLGHLFNIFLGDLAFVGPELKDISEHPMHARALVRYQVRPGLLSPHCIQKAVGIAYQDQDISDRDYVFSQSLKRDLALMGRGIPLFFLKSSKPVGSAKRLSVLGVSIDNINMDQALGQIQECAEEKKRLQVAFVNADCLNIACSHQAYRTALSGYDRVFADGIGLQIAARLLGRPLKANVNGTDLFPLLCERMALSGKSLFLLGARPGVAAQTAEKMRRRFQGLKIAGTHHGYFTEDDHEDVIAKVNASGADILLVGFGAPVQELWLEQHSADLIPSVRIGVGGLFDFYSERIPRAPLWMREMGLEWSWRLLQEPRRMWRRYVIGNPLFLARVLQQSMM